MESIVFQGLLRMLFEFVPPLTQNLYPQHKPDKPNATMENEPSSESSSSAEPVTAFNAPADQFPNTAIAESSESSSSSETAQAVPPETPAPKSAMDFVRSFISTIVACINTHCNQPGTADAKIAALKADIGNGISAYEHKHLDGLFATLKAAPAPINAVPEAPSPDAPLPPVVPPRTYPGINVGR